MATILIVKTYLLVYVLFFVGIYSFLTTLMLFSVFVLSYFKYRDPFNNAKDIELSSNRVPLVTIVVAVKNEEENIRNCVQSCINSTYQDKEIIIVNDGSTDRTAEILIQMQLENGSKIHVIHLPKNLGKKQAIEHATKIAKGEIYAFMDSDCDMHSDAVEKAVKIFLSDRNIGALASHARVRDVDKGTLLEKMQDVYLPPPGPRRAREGRALRSAAGQSLHSTTSRHAARGSHPRPLRSQRPENSSPPASPNVLSSPCA